MLKHSQRNDHVFPTDKETAVGSVRVGQKAGGGCESVLHVLPVCRVHGRCVAVAPQHDGGGQDVQRGVKLQSNTDTQKIQLQTEWKNFFSDL